MKLPRISFRRRRVAEDQRPSPVAYNAGKINRINADHVPAGLGPNALADLRLGLVRRRIRDLCDNNPHISGARRLIRNNVVGTGIQPQPSTRWPELNEQIEELWRVHSRGIDLDRCASMADVQGQALDEIFSAGEVLVVHALTEAHNGHRGGPAIELVDADLVPLDPMTARPSQGKAVVRQGVEFDASGRRVAYHVCREHPRDGGLYAGLASTETDRVPVSRADLVFVPRRVKQIRGVPWPVTVYDTVQLEEQFHEAYLMLARIAACVGVSVVGGHGSVTSPSNKFTDSSGEEIERLEPGMIGYLPSGATVNVLSASVPPPTFASTEEVMLRRMSAGLGVSYASLARDYGKATFSATRAESLEDRRGYRPLQSFIWKRIVEPHYRRCVDYWVASGELKLSAELRRAWLENREQVYRVQPIYPGWEWVNPAQDSAAAKTSMEGGITSLQVETANRGHHWRDMIDQRLEAERYERDRRAELGLEARAIGDSAASRVQEVVDDDEDEAEEDEADNPGNQQEDAA